MWGATNLSASNLNTSVLKTSILTTSNLIASNMAVSVLTTWNRTTSSLTTVNQEFRWTCDLDEVLQTLDPGLEDVHQNIRNHIRTPLFMGSIKFISILWYLFIMMVKCNQDIKFIMNSDDVSHYQVRNSSLCWMKLNCSSQSPNDSVSLIIKYGFLIIKNSFSQNW